MAPDSDLVLDYWSELTEDVEASALGVVYCANCKLPKSPLRPSGRCHACEKYKERHSGAERPVKLVLAEVARLLR